ncbi:MAG: class I SAM-dependent methyltransferase [Salinibacter sp.]
MTAIPSILDFAHTLAAAGLEPGGLAIDATVGNGHDTLFLVQEVGPGGRVVGFDVQPDALTATRERIQSRGPEASDRLRLVHAGHETMASHLCADDLGAVGAIMFNLGYLPGGDHSVTTKPATTRRALAASLELLRPGGVLTIVAYPGHEGGEAEAKAVADWTASLPEDDVLALSYRFPNQTGDPPRLYAVEKRGQES